MWYFWNKVSSIVDTQDMMQKVIEAWLITDSYLTRIKCSIFLLLNSRKYRVCFHAICRCPISMTNLSDCVTLTLSLIYIFQVLKSKHMFLYELLSLIRAHYCILSFSPSPQLYHTSSLQCQRNQKLLYFQYGFWSTNQKLKCIGDLTSTFLVWNGRD